MLDVDKIINDIITIEGEYSDNPADRGGPTRYGITEATARANGYAGDMKLFPIDMARRIYKRRYVTEPGFDLVAAISLKIATELMDTGVNMGPTKAAMFFQRLLNVLNVRGSRYADIVVDGKIGIVSISAFTAFLKFRGNEGEVVFLKALNAIQAVRYIEIAENNKSQEDFVYGWLKNRT